MNTISINMSQMDRWKVDQDNVKYYDRIIKDRGKILTLDARPYIEFCCEFNIFYTSQYDKPNNLS